MPRLTIHYPENTLFTYEIPLRITDINYAGHLAHDTLVSILHEVRARFFLAHGMREESTDGVGVIIADLGVVYKGEVFYPHVLRVEVAVTDIHSVGCDMVYRVHNCETGKLVALAKTGIVFFDFAKRHMAPMPPTFRRVIGASAALA